MINMDYNILLTALVTFILFLIFKYNKSNFILFINYYKLLINKTGI